MKKKLPARFWCALTIFSLMGQVAWVVENMYFNVFIYKMFNASAADISNMVAASAVTATLTTVFMGALSDKIGKRKLFICSGYILWGISIFSFRLPMIISAATIGISLTIILDCVMTFFGSTANDAAFNAWLTDSTDNSNRGAAEGINSMMPLVAILVVFGGFMFFDLSLPESWTWIFTIIGILVFVIGILGFFLIKEPNIKPTTEPYWKSIFFGFRPSTIKQNTTLYVSLAAFIIFNISIQIFMPYLIIYYEVSLGLTDYVFIMAPAIIIAAIVTAFWGKMYDKKGVLFSGILAVVALMLGYIILFLCKSTALVFVGSLLMMSGYLAGMAVFGATIRDYTPAGKAGMLQGVRIFSQVLLPGVIGPYIGKMVLANADTILNNDGTTSFKPNENIFLAALVVLVLILPFFLWIRKNKKPRTVILTTPFEAELKKTEIPFAEYPRPQMKRDSYLCLNGDWDFTIKGKKGTKFDDKITVPFPPESKISGVMQEIGKHDQMIYSRIFTLPEGFVKEKVFLHFGAVDQYAEVFVNGQSVGTHADGYLPFSFDITPYLRDGNNTLTVEAKDPLNLELPYGKQTNKRGGMWYTKVSGIWQTVWLESVPKNHIETLKITPALDKVSIAVQGGEAEKTLRLQTPEGEKTYEFTGDSVEITIENPHLWSPESPYLYDFSLTSGEDEVSSYFALRTVTIKDFEGMSRICLNGKPYFFHGLLDQGYFSDGIFLPGTEEGFKNDILQMKACGFNMLRKHIKLEPDLFYYYCDKYGMVVFQDMINSGKYGFLVDTALPTIGLKRGITHKAAKGRKEAFYRSAEGIIKELYNHPCVCYYTIFNEGWGQFEADQCYTNIKAMDTTRIFDTTSGWFQEQLSDVDSEHIYFKPVQLKIRQGRPMVLSEFGGYSCKIENHAFNLDKTYGYRYFLKREEFEKSLVELYEKEILPLIPKGLCAAVLTQVSDVEDETNGLLTYDRQVLKVNPEVMKGLAERIKL